jgi:hypothetical protein
MALIKRWKGALASMKVVAFWYLLISLMATVPGLNLLFAFMPPSAGAVFFLATALLALEPVATEALEAALPLFCFLPAIFYLGIYLNLSL